MLAFKALMCSLLVIASIFNMASARTCTGIQLSSNGYRYNSQVIAGAIHIVAMDVVRKISRSSCNFEYSYGYYGNTIWVNHGCRADFRVCYEGTFSIVSCSSIKYRPATCPISTGGKRIVALELKQQISRSACIKNQSFFLVGNAVRVIDGCRGSFRVIFAN